MSEWIRPNDLPEDNFQVKLHIGRYKFAAEMIKGNVVANAACSCNYGYPLLKRPGRLVIGFDRNDTALSTATADGFDLFVKKDIQGYDFDGFSTIVCLETFEHLSDPWVWLSAVSSSVRELVLSVPIIPTKHFNEWHLHDFTEADIKDGLKDRGWSVVHSAYQDEPGLANPTYMIVYAKR
jgi:2-polyprenyl-3-methyl-5-hydroxy-6-metoxy-1,4-benzoquinol methylase